MVSARFPFFARNSVDVLVTFRSSQGAWVREEESQDWGGRGGFVSYSKQKGDGAFRAGVVGGRVSAGGREGEPKYFIWGRNSLVFPDGALYEMNPGVHGSKAENLWQSVALSSR